MNNSLSLIEASLWVDWQGTGPDGPNLVKHGKFCASHSLVVIIPSKMVERSNWPGNLEMLMLLPAIPRWHVIFAAWLHSVWLNISMSHPQSEGGKRIRICNLLYTEK